MSDKGGKGYSVGKSSFKSPAFNGNDDNSAKSKGRKVQFDSEDPFDDKFDMPTSAKSDGKGDTPFAKGSYGKGGKGDKVGNAGKAPAKKDPPLVELRVEQELPEKFKCVMLMDCEAAQILEGIQDHMVLLSTDPTIKIPSSFDRALQYASKGKYYTNPQAVRQLLESLKKHGVSDSEICMIANTAIDSTGQAFSLMPSLKAKKKNAKEALRSTLMELEKLKTESAKNAIVID